MSIYLDHAATTPTDKHVLDAMLPYFSEIYANPSSLHAPGQNAGKAVKNARRTIAEILNGHEDEIIFTSGGTESDNLALIGVVRATTADIKSVHGPDAVPHVITTAIEHPAVLEPLERMKRNGEITVSRIVPKPNGIVDVAEIMNAMTEKTVLISVMYANNEIGSIQPIAEIGRAILKYRKQKETAWPLFHSDACQAGSYLDLNVEKLHTDLLTLNGGKIYGPKGIGVLFVRRGTRLTPQSDGGGQERGLRAGTENVPGIIGMAKALQIAQEMRETESVRLSVLRDAFIEGLLRIPKSRLNGDAEKRLPNNVNVSFLDIEGEAAMLYLDAKGIACSTGSACASSKLDPSHVVCSLGLSYEAAHGSLRFTMGRSTTTKDVQYVLNVIPGIIERLRKMSPTDLNPDRFMKETLPSSL